MVVDTSVFIEFLRAKQKQKTTLYQLPDVSDLRLSSVTLYELYMGAPTPDKRNQVLDVTEDLITIPFDEEIASKAADIYHSLKRQNKLIEFRDIFIAATALAHNMELATLNKKHFERIEGLKLFNLPA